MHIDTINHLAMALYEEYRDGRRSKAPWHSLPAAEQEPFRQKARFILLPTRTPEKPDPKAESLAAAATGAPAPGPSSLEDVAKTLGPGGAVVVNLTTDLPPGVYLIVPQGSV